jgi:hypothetical protein
LEWQNDSDSDSYWFKTSKCNGNVTAVSVSAMARWVFDLSTPLLRR